MKPKCTTGCPRSKKNSAFQFSRVYDQFRLIETFNLEVEPEINIRTVQFDSNELKVIPDSDSFGSPLITTLGAATHTGGDLKGVLTFSSSGQFEGRLSATVNGTLINSTETFSASAGLNSLTFNLGNVGVADVIFTIHNLGTVTTTDFVTANIVAGSEDPNATITPITNGFNLVVGPANLVTNGRIASFNAKAQAGIWNVVRNDATGAASRGVRMNINSTSTLIAQRPQTDGSIATEYSIGYGFGNPKMEQIDFVQAGGAMGNGLDVDFVFDPAKDIAVDITDGEITIF